MSSDEGPPPAPQDQTFKGRSLRDMERRGRPGNRILGVPAMRCHYLMERRNSVTGLELRDFPADGVHVSGYIIALVRRLLHHAQNLPVLRVQRRSNDADENLGLVGRRDRRVSDGHGDVVAGWIACEGFLHCACGSHVLSVCLSAGKNAQIWTRRLGYDIYTDR